jgi:hypothetical protein
MRFSKPIAGLAIGFVLSAPAAASSSEILSITTPETAFADAFSEDASPYGATSEIRQNLLAVGAGFIQSDEQDTTIMILGQSLIVTYETTFPRGTIASGDYVAVIGMPSDDQRSIATSIIRLGGQYSPGSTPVFLRGRLSAIDSAGLATVGATRVDLSQAYYDTSLLDVTDDSDVAVLGFEVTTLSSTDHFIVATSAIASGSGARGSGARGITGSGARGITGSGARGITGSGARGITGSGARGITGSGARGITGSGARGITGSGMK